MMDPIELHAYADGELDKAQQAEIRKRLAEGAPEAREVEAIQGLKSMLRDRIEQPEVGDSWKACVKRLDEIDKSRRVEAFVSRFAPALCGVFFLCIVTAGLMNRNHGPESTVNANLGRFLGGFSKPLPTSKTEDEFVKNIIESYKSTPRNPVLRGEADAVVDGMPAKKYLFRDLKGDFEMVTIIGQHIQFDGALANNPDDLVQVGNFGRVNYAAKFEGPNTVVIIADRTPDELLEILQKA